MILYSTNTAGLDPRTGKSDVIKQRETLWVDAVKDTMTFKYTGKHLKLVNIDADQILLAEKDQDKSREESIFQFYNAPLYIDRRDGLLACKSSSKPECVQVLIDGLDDPFWNIRELAVRNIRKAVRKRPEDVKAKLMSIAESDPKSGVRAAAIGALEKHFGSKEDLTEVFEKGAKDSSYYVVSVSIQSLADKDLDKAYTMAQALES